MQDDCTQYGESIRRVGARVVMPGPRARRWRLPACALGLALLLAGCGGVTQRPPADDLTQAQLVASCAFPALDGNGQRADDIPRANTPGCAYTAFPAPVLAGCREPLAAGAPDMRGVWRDPREPGAHIERIEQCGDRLVVTAGGIVHDMRVDGTYENGVNDVAARDCSPISVSAAFEAGTHVLRPKGIPVTVTRRLDGARLVWKHPSGNYVLERVCGPGSPPAAGASFAR
jgi:hypothetical protein